MMYVRKKRRKNGMLQTKEEKESKRLDEEEWNMLTKKLLAKINAIFRWTGQNKKMSRIAIQRTKILFLPFYKELKHLGDD